MKTIWRYEIPIKQCFEIEMPKDARILLSPFGSVQIKEGIPCIWVLVNTEEKEKINMKFRIFGTGEPFPEKAKNLFYIGTFQMQGHITFVWHLFQEIINIQDDLNSENINTLEDFVSARNPGEKFEP